MSAKIKGTLVTINIILSGFVAFFISLFYAGGAIGDTDTYTLEFFLIVVIWLIGILALWKTLNKKEEVNPSKVKIIVINLLLWLSIPVGLLLSFLIV